MFVCVCVYGHMGKNLSEEQLLSARWYLWDCPSNLLWRESQRLQLCPFRLSHPSQCPPGPPAPVLEFAFEFEASCKASLWILQGFCRLQFDIQADPHTQERMTQSFIHISKFPFLCRSTGVELGIPKVQFPSVVSFLVHHVSTLKLITENPETTK